MNSSSSSIQDSALDVGQPARESFRSSAFSSSPFGQTLPDIETESAFSEQLPRSTFAPPPVNTPAADYDAIYGPLNAELDRLELLAITIRMRARIAQIIIENTLAAA